MTIISNQWSAATLSTLCRYTNLPLAIAGLLLSAQAQAFLPTPLSIVTTGELAPTQGKTNLSDTMNVSAEVNRETSISVTQNADAELLLAAWRNQAKSDNLAQHTTWRRLLYFIDDKKGVFAKKNNKSLVDDNDFFLSANGQQDSAAELDATLIALSKEMTTAHKIGNSSKAQASNNDSVLCRFPARVNWLTQTLGIDISSLQADCPELDSWMKKLAPEQLSVMFAEEYLDNPISAFAHTLLRIDSAISAKDFTQIHHAYALNDTVDGDKEDSFAIFTAKSLTGGYNNIIEIDPYPKKLADYLQVDERDTWTYQLDLTPSEVQQIMLHVWETKDLALPYYFATDNCASEILRLIDSVRPKQHLLSQLPYVVVPSDVVNLLNKEKLLASSRYTPADSSVRQAQLNKATQAAKLGYQDLTKDTANKIKSADINPASSLSADGQNLLPLTIDVSNNNPLDRHSLQRASLGIGHRGDNSYIDLGVRAGFHDTLDRSAGFDQFFNLEGLAATLRLYDHKDNDEDNNQPESVVLQNVTLIRGRSFNPVNSAQKGTTWGVSVEATRINDGSQQEGADHLVASTTVEYGKSWALGTARANTGEMPPQLCYTLATGAVQAGRGINKGYRVGAGINAGCLYQINNRLRAQAQLQLPYWYHGNSDQADVQGHYWQPITTLGLQYDIDKNQALRFDASYDWQDRVDANDDIKLAYMRYF